MNPRSFTTMPKDPNARFPHGDVFPVGGSELKAHEILELVGPLMTQGRRARMRQVIAGRTYSVVPVLENIYDRGNASAVMRTAEALGYQCVHVVEPGERFKEANRVTQGADKWLDVRRWKKTSDCIADLKAKGYLVYATHLEAARPLAEIDFTRPTALVLGNEKDGVSPELLELADDRVIIPMHGFVQSFNISVAAALALYHGFLDRTRKLGAQGDLTPEEREILEAIYILRSSKNPERLVQKLLQRRRW